MGLHRSSSALCMPADHCIPDARLCARLLCKQADIICATCRALVYASLSSGSQMPYLLFTVGL